MDMDSRSLHDDPQSRSNSSSLQTSLPATTKSSTPTHSMPSARYKSYLHSIFLSVFLSARSRLEVSHKADLHTKLIITRTDTLITISSRVAPINGGCLDLTISFTSYRRCISELDFRLSFETGWHEDWRENQSGVWDRGRGTLACLRNNLFLFFLHIQRFRLRLRFDHSDPS